MNTIEIVEELGRLGMIKPHKISGNWYQCTCPLHKGGNENRPSFGILLKEEYRNGTMYPSLFSHCFTCQFAGTLPELLTQILKSKSISMNGLDWLKENIPGFTSGDVDFDYLIPPEMMQATINKFAVQQIQQMSNPVQYVTEEELAKYRFTVPYMYERKLTDKIIEDYDIGFQADWIPPGRKRPVPCITIPVRDKEGRTLFFCRRSVEGKLYNYPEGVTKPVFGIDKIQHGSPVIICESAINALTAVAYGYQAVALLGTGNSYQAQQLKELGIDDYVLCFDGDEAGRKATEKWERILSKVAFVLSIKMPDGKDLNDCTKEEFDKLYDERE